DKTGLGLACQEIGQEEPKFFAVGNVLQGESFAEVEPAYIRITDDVLRLAVRQNLARMNDIGPVNETQGFTNVVIGDEHADSAGRQMLHKLLDVGHCDGVNTGEGFVQEHEVGLARKGAGDFEAATLTTG